MTQFSLLSEKFINLLMQDGQKSSARKVFFEMLTGVAATKHEKISVLEIFRKALDNVMPSLQVRKVRIAGTTYLVPSILSKKKQESLAMRWIIESAKIRKKNSRARFCECLSHEILDAFKKQGQARQKRDELHRVAQINRAYVRYRWW